jgi:surfeit locus 1 family protein
MGRSALALILVLALAALCVRLGFWQIDRWHEKRRLNAETRASLESPPLELNGAPASLESVRGHRVAVSGRFDESHQILLSYRTHDGAPGVEVVTPLVLEEGQGAVLVDRGWLYAADGATARLEGCEEPGPRQVLGLPAEIMRGRPRGRSAEGATLRALAGASASLWSARWLDVDTLARRLPYAIAPWMLRELPGPGVPGRPLRPAPRPLDEWTHVSYAVQWFLFGSILLGGTGALAWSRGRRASRPRRVPSESAADPDLSRRA